MITECLFVIAVPDLERSATFYRDVLGFTVTKLGDYGWRMFVRDNCKIMAGECPDAISPLDLGDHSYFAYLIVDDVDAYHRRVLTSSTEVVKPPRDEPWGMREFGLRTVDGHRIMLGSRIGAPSSPDADKATINRWFSGRAEIERGYQRTFTDV